MSMNTDLKTVDPNMLLLLLLQAMGMLARWWSALAAKLVSLDSVLHCCASSSTKTYSCEVVALIARWQLAVQFRLSSTHIACLASV